MLGLSDQQPAAGKVRLLRETTRDGVCIQALVMTVSDTLSIPGYLLLPVRDEFPGRAVIALHGHGEVEPCLGQRDDYHHAFALELAKAGHVVLCPELRGFGTLSNLSEQVGGQVTYWQRGRPRSFALASDAFQHNQTMLGETVEDLIRWEEYLVVDRRIARLDVAGISYGGDLALLCPVFSSRVERIFASGTLGSFEAIFAQGDNAPRPILIHYGALDTPGPTNGFASYNQSAEPSVAELKTIYKAFHAESAVNLLVSPNTKHEIDLPKLLEFLQL